MGQPNKQSENVVDLTLQVAKSIDATFFKLKHAYNALILGDFFVEIINLQGGSIDVSFDTEDYDSIKLSVIEGLESLDVANLSEEQTIKIAFYLGLICSTLTHGNVPLPEALNYFGKLESEIER